MPEEAKVKGQYGRRKKKQRFPRFPRGFLIALDTVGPSDTFVVPDLPAERYREIKAKKQREQ
jgi:hypothetical protein